MKTRIIVNVILWVLCVLCVCLYVVTKRPWNVWVYICVIDIVMLPISLGMVLKGESKLCPR